MANIEGSNSGPCTDFPAPGLRVPNRYISGHNEDGEAIFLQVRTQKFERDGARSRPKKERKKKGELDY